MKVVPTKGKYKGEEIEIISRIVETNVYRAKRIVAKTTIDCYVHCDELNGMDRIRCRQNMWSRVRAKTYVKLWFFFSDTETLFIRMKNWMKNIKSKWNY